MAFLELMIRKILKGNFKMNLKILSDSDLISQTRLLVKQEQKIVEELVNFLQEIYERRLFAKLGYSGMFNFMTQ